MAQEPIIADIQSAFLEYNANFKDPIISLWYGGQQDKIINVVLKALSPWQVTLENVTWNQAAKNLREVQLTVGVPSLLSSMQISLSSLTMSSANPSSAIAPALVSLYQTGIDAVKNGITKDFRFHQVTLGFHVKPTSKPFKEIISQFVNVKALGGEDAAMYGVSAYSPAYSFVIDSSAIVSGGVFIKLIRNFDIEKPFAEIAAILRKDEEAVLNRLGLKLQ